MKLVIFETDISKDFLDAIDNFTADKKLAHVKYDIQTDTDGTHFLAYVSYQE